MTRSPGRGFEICVCVHKALESLSIEITVYYKDIQNEVGAINI